GRPARALQRASDRAGAARDRAVAARTGAGAAAASDSAALLQRARPLRPLLVPLLRGADRRTPRAAGREGDGGGRSRRDRDRRRRPPVARARRAWLARPGRTRSGARLVSDRDRRGGRADRLLRRVVLRVRAGA